MAEEEQKQAPPPGEEEGDRKQQGGDEEVTAAPGNNGDVEERHVEQQQQEEEVREKDVDDDDETSRAVATLAELNPATLDADLLEQWEERQAELAEKLATARKMLQSKAVAESKRKQQEAVAKYDRLAAEVKEVEKNRKRVEQKVELLKTSEAEDSRHDAGLEAEIEHVEQERLLDKVRHGRGIGCTRFLSRLPSACC